MTRLRGSICASALPVLLAGGFVADLSQPVQAQATTARVLDEIVVTAQRREQNVQDVAIAITAFSGDLMDRFGFVESTEIAAMVPGISISASAGDQSRQFSIRGVTQNDFADHTEPPNAVYIDEGYIAAPQGQVFALFDLERVEVLKGPQGTLFGRNATGGLVHYISRKPTREFEAFADLTYGRYNQVRFEGAVSGPLTETVAARLSVMSNRHDEILENIYPYGNSENVLTGLPFVPSHSGQDDFWNDNQIAARGQILWDISSEASFSLSAFGARQKVSVGAQQSRAVTAVVDGQGRHVDSIFAVNDPLGCEMILSETGGCVPIAFLDGEIPGLTEDAVRPRPGGDLFGYIDPDGSGFKTSADHALDNFNAYHTAGATGTLNWDLGGATLNSVTHYAYFDKRQTLDADAAPAPQSLVLQEAEHNTFSQEFRLNGEAGALRWLAGVYYLHIDVNYAQGLAFSADSPISHLFFGGAATESPIFVDMKTNSYSAFSQLDLDITEQFTLTGGIRVIQEKKSYAYDNFWFMSIRDHVIDSDQTPLPIPVDAAGGGARYPSFRGDTDDTLWAGKLQLEFRPIEDILLYAGYNRGVKAGGFNAKLNDFAPAPADEDIPYAEEILHAYEAGFKTSLFNGSARLNGSAFYYDYNGYQAFVFSGSSGLIRNTDATFKGAELQFDAVPTENLSVMAAASYIDATVKDLPIAPGVIRDVRPTFTPKWQLSGLVRYDLPLETNGEVGLQLDGSYQGASYYNIRNFAAQKMDSRKIVNAQVSWTSPNRNWTTILFVDNIFDERYKVGGFDLATLCGCAEEAYGKPRWFGVRVRVSTN